MRRPRSTRSALLAAVLCPALAAGCSGSIGDSKSGNPGNPQDPTGKNPNPTPGQPNPGDPAMPTTPTGPIGGPKPPANPPGPLADEPGPAQVRRLTRLEYNNTVRDLLGDNSRPGDRFPGDQEAGKSGFLKGGAVSDVDATQLLETTRDVATRALTQMATLVPCTAPASPAAEETCAKDFITKFGRRAFRRPVATAEATELLDLWKAQRAPTIGQDFPNSIRVLIEAMLLSPNFLYRWELGSENPLREGQLVRFNGHEMASRLSYFLWASMPDQALFDAADADHLSTPQQIEEQARRLLKDPRAIDAMADFHLQWLGIGGTLDAQKDSTVYPKFTKELAQSMLNETRAFVGQVMGPKGDGKIETLLTSSDTFVDSALASLYGVSGGGGSGLSPVKLDPAQRAGLLTQPNFLTVLANTYETHPVKRGVAVLEQVLCRELPRPPQNVPEPSAAKDGVSTRERYSEHSKNECAKACHAQIDPMGFAFENYDGIGAWRTMDYGKPVDASGTVELRSGSKSFKNAIELLPALAADSEAHECFAKQWLRYSTRRQEVPGDAAALDSALQAFNGSGHDLREMIVAIAKSRAFTHRTPSAGEVLQ